MKKRLKGCSCFSFFAIIISAAIFIFAVVEIVFVSFYELKKTETSGPWPFDQRPGYAVFAVAISFLLPPFPLTVTAIAKKDRNYIFWACFPLVAAFTSLLVFGSVTIRTSQKDLSHELFNVMKQSRTDPKLANWLSLLQYEYKCCGVTGYSDWNLFQEGNYTGFPLPKDSVPYTCCKRENVNIKTGCGDGVLGMSGASRKNIIYTRPCGSMVGKVFQAKVLQLGLEMLLAAFAAIISATFLYCGATELFCFGGTNRTFQNNNLPDVPVRVRKSGASVVSFRMDEFEDENDNEVGNNNPADIPDRKSVPNNRVRIDSRGHVRSHSPKNGGRRGSRIPPPGHVRIKENSDKRRMSSASCRSGSKSRSKGKPLEDSGGVSKGPLQKLQVKAIVKGRHVLREQSLERRKPEYYSKALAKEGPSRHFGKPIVKDVNANTTKANLVETLFKGIDMNISALSTTPNPSGTVNFPWTTKHGSRSSTIIGKGTPSSPSVKDPSQGANIKALLPTLSHFSSLPLFQLVKFPTGETSVLSQYSPHFVHKTLPLPSSTLHTRQTYVTAPSPSFFKPIMPVDVPPTDTKDLEIEVVQELPVLPIIQCEETMAIGKHENTTPKAVEIELEVEGEDKSSIDNSISSTTRSITHGGPLATIVEESESIKSSPECGTSPEMSGSNSPKGSEFGAVGGEWRRSVVGQSPSPSVMHLKSQEDEDLIRVKEIPSLERKVTGEFQV